MVDTFLEMEVESKEMADEILHFINSFEIRKGEFECNCYVIEKLDLNTFLIYCDLTDQDGLRTVSDTFSIYRNDLQKAILSNVTHFCDDKTTPSGGCDSFLLKIAPRGGFYHCNFANVILDQSTTIIYIP